MHTRLSYLAPGALAILVGLFAVGCADTPEPARENEDAIRAPAEWTALPDVRRASYALEDAAAVVEETDARLARQLSQIGPALTNAQKQKYTTAFLALPDVTANHQRFITAARDLDRELGKLEGTRLADVMATIHGGALGLDHYGPNELYADYKLLAGSPIATGALAFGIHVAAQEPAYARVRIAREQVESEIVAPALPAALVEQLLRTGTVDGALDALEAKTKLLEGSQAARVLSELRQFRASASAAVFTASLDTPMGKAETACGAVIAIWEAGGVVAARPQFEAALLAILRGGPSAVGTLARAINVLRVNVLGLPSSELAAGVANAAVRIGGGTTVVLGLFNLLGPPGQLGDLDKWNANLSDKIRIVGDLVGIAGGVAALLALGPAGPVLGVLALGISIFATLLHDREIADQDARDKRGCLPALGLAPALTDTLLRSSKDVLQRMHDDMGFAPEQIQWLATTSPHLVVDDVPHVMAWKGFQVSHAIFGLTPTQNFELAQAVVGDAAGSEDREFMLLHFLIDIDADPSWNAGLSRAQALAWMAYSGSPDKAGGWGGHERDMWMAIFAHAKTYLAAH